MNGQPYNYSGSNSGNGTPTPSSTSYPASLSSQSSRDVSPARAVLSMNHNNVEKMNNFSAQRYKNQEYANMHGTNYNDDLIGSRSQASSYPTDAQHFVHQGVSSAPVHDPQSQLYRPENNYYQDTNKIQEQPLAYDPTLNHTYVNQPSPYTAPKQTTYTGVDSYHHIQTTQAVASRPNYLAGNYQQYSTTTTTSSPIVPAQQPLGGPPLKSSPPVQTVPPTREEPLSSGPPRTNVLGIIPYTTDPVTAMSQSNLASPKTLTSVSQLTSNHVSHNVKPLTPPQLQQPATYNQQHYQYQQQQPLQQQPSLPPQQQQQQQQQMATAPLQGMRPPPLQQSQPTSKPFPNQYPNATAYNSTNNYIQQQQTPPYNYNQAQNNVAYANYNSGPTAYYPGADDLVHQMAGMTVNAGYNKLWGREAIDLLKSREILPTHRVEPPTIRLAQEFSTNCSPDIFRCTLTRIPETKSLLDKSRLPLGVLIHPFKDLNQLSVIQCSVIVRCRSCRTYINPFVYFVDSKRWKCNLCFRDNELPEEFQYDPLTKTYGDPSRRPEIKSATIEFIAPSEYMVRPPQPAAYVFVIDVSRLGAEAGYLKVFCDCLLSQLEALPGDSRTSVAFITFDSTVHYYSLAETQALPHQMVVVDIDDMFVPCPDNLLVNLSECLGLVRDLLKELPFKYNESYDTGSALGPALQAAYKLLAATGGRITVFQSCLANSGPGKLLPREDPSQRSGENVNQAMLNPITDFYKKLALDCSGQQIAVDLFILNSQYVDLASLSGIAKFSGGCIHHFPLFSGKNVQHVESLQRSLHRYLCRKIGFESVMRLRCTRGLSIHTFHGNFFVRSTDLLSLPNVNPDAGFGMQVSIDENLSDIQNVCFQAALLYTSSKGERRIRVHTLCLPIASNLSDVLHSADQQCIAGLLAKMAVDRCHQSSLSDAREAFVNVVADMLSAYKMTQSSGPSTSLLIPPSLRLLPLYVLALLKSVAFKVGQSTRLDDRLFAMCQMKSLPLSQLIQMIYPDLYPVHNLCEYSKVNMGEETVVQPPLLHLTAERIDSHGVYLMDDGIVIMIYVGHNISPALALALFNAPSFSSINANMTELPELDNEESKELRTFVNYLQNEKPIAPTVEIIRDDSPHRHHFLEKLIEDKTETGYSYYEFLQRVKQLVK